MQRRHQKVVEIAPAFQFARCQDSSMRSASRRHRRSAASRRPIENAGTVEFLFDDRSERAIFTSLRSIPRIQVEHTVTEDGDGDRHRQDRRFSIAQGDSAFRAQKSATSVHRRRTSKPTVLRSNAEITTEDPANNFMPGLRSRSRTIVRQVELGVRLDGGPSAFSGAVINPFYDSLLVKVSVRQRPSIWRCGELVWNACCKSFEFAA